MTAEIVIMNRLGIALAADSAVTLGGVEKIYTSADKLFLLSENAPVGAMVYGNADLLGIPWETIIKVFRKHLGNKIFSHLDEYANSIIEFLCSNEMFAESYQNNFVIAIAQTYYTFFRDELLKPRLEEELQKKKLTEKDIKNILGNLVKKELDTTEQFEALDNLPNDFITILKLKYETIVVKIKDEIFQDLPTKKSTNVELINIVFELLSRRRFGPFDSGFVIAGFGEDDHFPEILEIRLQGIAANKLLYYRARHEKIGENNIAFIAPFAQQEMVYTFMEGIDPALREMIEESTTTLFRGAINIILDMVKKKRSRYSNELKKASNHLDEMVTNLIKEWNAKRRDDYWGPIMDIVASLPKDELGAMAESLVNLTKFKRRVSKQQETVGGPIDVAIITKGDGFIWIKRKHYFRSELNPRFISKYYNNSEEGIYDPQKEY